MRMGEQQTPKPRTDDLHLRQRTVGNILLIWNGHWYRALKMAENDSGGSDTGQVGAPLKRPRKRNALNQDISSRKDSNWVPQDEGLDRYYCTHGAEWKTCRSENWLNVQIFADKRAAETTQTMCSKRNARLRSDVVFQRTVLLLWWEKETEKG